MTARDRFNAELATVLDAGHVVVCAATGLATSDDPAERAQAALDCRPCPLLDACRELGREERAIWGVWGGIDLSPSARGAGRPRKASA